MRTNPFVIAAANALIPGTGYLILQERVVFGALLTGAILSFAAVSFLDPAYAQFGLFMAESTGGRMLETLYYALSAAAFAYDGFALAREKRDASRWKPAEQP